MLANLPSMRLLQDREQRTQARVGRLPIAELE